MPKFIGQEIPGSRPLLDDDATEASTGLVRLTYRQASLLSPESVWYSLDKTDRGSRGTYAKRWYRWFASRESIRNCPRSTHRMLWRAMTKDDKQILAIQTLMTEAGGQ